MTTLSIETLFEILQPTCFFRGQTTLFEGLTDHSSHARPGLIFFALPSSKRGAEGFIDLALHKGATAIVAPEAVVLKKRLVFSHITFFGVKEIRYSLSKISGALHPERPSFMAAVTGTNGKTSIANLALQLWQHLGKKAASLGTLGLQGVDVEAPQSSLTTMEPLAFYPLLSAIAKKGISHCVLEASSHGLDQRRLDDIAFHAGVFSSFSRDHLDYHGNMRTYWLSKARLFKELVVENGIAILNDNLSYPYELAEACRRRNLRMWFYGFDKGDFRIKDLKVTPRGQEVLATCFGKEISFAVPLIGRFQAANVMAAILLVHASGVDIADILKVTPLLKSTPGRLEYVGASPKGGHVYLDYAHTPDALEIMLQHMRPHTKKRLFVLFGCGGDRDKGKRSLMGAVATTYADEVIVTDDNPRYEDPSEIRQNILKGAQGAREIAERADAILTAVSELEKDDVLVIAGKGHETLQWIGSHSVPFSDQQVALRAIKQLQSA
ncbi:MAG: UDP-N-acetylmuramoyl-L-alanyl-D-glutamate--2,6-diaminopimelate ligase [Holosporaceae bacterium]